MYNAYSPGLETLQSKACAAEHRRDPLASLDQVLFSEAQSDPWIELQLKFLERWLEDKTWHGDGGSCVMKSVGWQGGS